MPPRPPPRILPHVTTIGIRRPGYGSSGLQAKVYTNHFQVSIPQGTIHHYDVVILPADRVLPAKLNLLIIKALQEQRQDVFTPKVVYDGRKNIFAVRELQLRNRDNKGQASEEFKVTLPPTSGGEPKEYKVRLTKVAEINPEVLQRFLQGRQSHDNHVLTAITALNVVIRMTPNSKYPFNVRSFFTDAEKQDIGGGLVLWRGYFQSIRPGGDRMWINIDISTGTMYMSGTLINVCLAHLNLAKPRDLTSVGGFGERDRIRLQRFIAGLRVTTTYGAGDNPRVIKKLTAESAGRLRFRTREGTSMGVAEFFTNTYRTTLTNSDLPCVEVGSGALIPMELCKVPPGQIMRKQVPPEKTRDVLAFSTQRPNLRLESIRRGIAVFEYGQSEYLRSFGMQVRTEVGPATIDARVLQPPSLLYGVQGKQRGIVNVKAGAWNMRDKTFFSAAQSTSWLMVVFEREGRFNRQAANEVAKLLSNAAESVGIRGIGPSPYITFQNTQSSISELLVDEGRKWRETYGQGKHLPGIIVVILPEGAAAIYSAVKHFGDCQAGVATQCLKANKCRGGSLQYFANVCLKINVKLGGVNCVPTGNSIGVLTDPSSPVMILGADVIHPAPGADGKPSFTALVGNVDIYNCKYVARTCVQESRVEMIQDLEEMTKNIMEMYRTYGGTGASSIPPKRVIFYRDGVSEGQFKTVLDEEVPRIKAAFETVGLTGAMRPKLTVIVVGKRHHVRFFPVKDNGEKSGNCQAGTVVDTDISHPTEFDFYLQSHTGILGTSRPAHYSVLLDENKFTADAMQQLSFALCHVYARATRSVSIPAPVYYADIVCSRAKNHFNPNLRIDLETPTPTQSQAAPLRDIHAYRNAFKPPHNNAALNMYFS